jgi:hypothetical protein
LAFLVATAVLLFPEVIHKSCLPLIVIAHSAMVAVLWLGSNRNGVVVLAAGVLLGITFLLRVDLGGFLLAISLAVLAADRLLSFDCAAARGAIFRDCAVLLLAISATNLPVILVGLARGIRQAISCAV